MADVEGKKLTELRVIDLKTELERRGLDKTGNKAALLERLAKAIIEEGGNPDECLIVPSGGTNRTSPKKPIDTSILIEDVLETEIQKEEFNNDFDGLDKSTSNYNAEESNAEESCISISAHPEDLEMECQETEQEPTITTTSEEPIPEKKPFVPSEESSNVSTVEANGIDNEDSINLTIGEDEENLLVEESESNDRPKDGGSKKRSEESNDSINDSNSSNKKGDSKGSGRAESGASNKEGTSSATSGTNATGVKSKQEGEGSKSGDSAAKGPKKDDKEKSLTVSANASSRNLWVSGLSSTTRATDLKQIFSKYGKVIGAKVVTNARTPGARCYGYVTMSTSDDAEKCIEYLHRTELHGRVISVEKAKGDSSQSHSRKREPTTKVDKKDEKEKVKEAEPTEAEAEKTEDETKTDEVVKEPDDKDTEESAEREKRETSLDNKDEGSLKDCDTRSNKSNSKKSDRERASSREDKKRSWDRSRTSRSKSRERHRRDNNVLSFDKIKEERERQRLREKERLLREEKRRRREDMERQRAIEREAARLEREREKLRLERERIEQEKAELLRLERERQKLEREKLERERLELKRQQMRMEENRRPPPPPALKRTSSDRREPRDVYEPERKRITSEHPARRHSPPERPAERRTDVMERVSDRRIDNAAPSRYEGRAKGDVGIQKGGFKRGNDFASRNNRDDQYNDTRGGGSMMRRDTRPNQNTMDHRPVKERYERPANFGREVHTRDDNHRPPRDNHNRYDNTKPNNPRDDRYDNNRQTGWHSGPPSKPFNAVNNRNEQSGWNSRSSDTQVNSRWNNSNNMGNNMGHPRSQMYQGRSNQYQGGMSQGNSGGGSYNRFEPYNKGSMQNMRRY